MYQQQQQKPRRLEGIAGLLAKQGRYGDSMLVHMNPIEVEGLASMSPTGSLTINPETGQPEAFLPLLIPLIGSLAGSAALTGLGATAATVGGAAATAGLSSAAAGAIGSGLAQWAYTGDLKQGLVSGITGFGVGSALGAIGAAGAKGAEAGVVAEAGADAAVAGGGTLATTDPSQALAQQGMASTSPAVAVVTDPTQAAMQIAGAGDKFAAAAAAADVPANFADGTIGERLGQIASEEGIGALTSTQALIPTALAEGYNADVAAEAAMEDWDKTSGRMSKAELARQGKAIVANQFDPNLTPGSYNPSGSDYGGYGAQYANAGGIVSLDPDDFKKRYNGLMEMGRPIVGMMEGGGMGDYGRQVGLAGYGSPFPAAQQAALRGPNTISPEQLQDTYAQQGMPGFGPEIMYFTRGKDVNPNPFKDWVPDPDPDPESDPASDPESDPASAALTIEDLSKLYQNEEITKPEYLQGLGKLGVGSQPTTSAEGTTTGAAVETTPAPTVESGLSPTEYANLYSEYMDYGSDFGVGMKEGGEAQVNADADRLIDLAAMAVLGELPEEEAGVVIQAFIDEFGEEAFSALRESVLEGIVPGSQKEGEIVGPGGGMDDQIMGMIGNQQPVAVSPGEYIVPADVVSGIGDGSTDAGVQQLDGMLDRVRVERTNTTQQPRPLRKGGVLPR